MGSAAVYVRNIIICLLISLIAALCDPLQVVWIAWPAITGVCRDADVLQVNLAFLYL